MMAAHHIGGWAKTSICERAALVCGLVSSGESLHVSGESYDTGADRGTETWIVSHWLEQEMYNMWLDLCTYFTLCCHVVFCGTSVIHNIEDYLNNPQESVPQSM